MSSFSELWKDAPRGSEEAYQRRLRLLREIVAGDNQAEFADRLGIAFKRWSNYERGYPVPREVAFVIMKKLPGISVEWLWFGMEGNLSQAYLEKIRAAEKLDQEQRAAARAAVKANARLRELTRKRVQEVHPPRSSPPRR